MQITPAVLDAIFYTFDKRFQEGYQRAPKWAARMASEVPSTSRETRYAWIKWIPRLREWLGDRKVNNVSARGFTITNKNFELTQAVDRNDIEDDNIGVYAPLLEMMGMQAALWPEDMMTTLLASAESALCFDGQPFFSASHPVDMDNAALSTYANLFPGTALTAANFNTVRTAMRGYLAEDGKPLLVNPNLLVVPPALEQTAKQLMNAEFIVATFGANAATGSQTNVLKGSADVLVVPELAANPTEWYLMDASKPIKPFVFQLRKAPQLVQLVDPSSPNVFNKREFIYGLDSRGNCGFSLPFLCAKAKA